MGEEPLLLIQRKKGPERDLGKELTGRGEKSIFYICYLDILHIAFHAYFNTYPPSPPSVKLNIQLSEGRDLGGNM